MQIKIKLDRNGNKTVSIPGNQSGRGFSIQTNGNLPGIHRLPKGAHALTRPEVEELHAYLTLHGSNERLHVFARAAFPETF